MSSWKDFLDDIKSIPSGRHIGSKVIFDIVYNPDGTFKKFKARMLRGETSYEVSILIILLVPLNQKQCEFY